MDGIRRSPMADSMRMEERKLSRCFWSLDGSIFQPAPMEFEFFKGLSKPRAKREGVLHGDSKRTSFMFSHRMPLPSNQTNLIPHFRSFACSSMEGIGKPPRMSSAKDMGCPWRRREGRSMILNGCPMRSKMKERT